MALVGVEPVRPSRPPEQLGVVHPGQLLGFGYAAPEAERAVEQRRRGAWRLHALGRSRRGDRAAQRFRLLLGGVVVVGDGSGEQRRVLAGRQARLERPRQT